MGALLLLAALAAPPVPPAKAQPTPVGTVYCVNIDIMAGQKNVGPITGWVAIYGSGFATPYESTPFRQDTLFYRTVVSPATKIGPNFVPEGARISVPIKNPDGTANVVIVDP